MNNNTYTIKSLCIFLVMFLLGFAAGAKAQTIHQFDVAIYKEIARQTVGNIIKGTVNADEMIANMEKLLALGKEGCAEHMNEAETPPVEAKLMKLALENAEKMISLSLEQIEEKWHEGGFPKSNGIDIEKFDHFSEVMSHYDSLVHPATAIICLKEYKTTKNNDLLEQVKDELAEVIEHLKHLE
ncbi:MAG: hypothetical protein ACMUIP_03085 [bacterium]